MRNTRTYTEEEKQQILEEVKNCGNVSAVAKTFTHISSQVSLTYE